MRLFRSWWLRLLLIMPPVVVAALLVVTVVYSPSRIEVINQEEGFDIGEWEDLEALPWVYANTAWVAVANEGTPTLGKSFTGGSLSIAGEVYDRGIGTYPLSEIEYRLDGQYLAFESDIGVDDSVPSGQGGVQFQVYFDDALVFSSKAMKSGDPPIQVKLTLLGVTTMRLVTIDATDGAVRNYANWANPKVMKRLATVSPMSADPILSIVQDRNSEKKKQRDEDRKAVEAEAKTEIANLRTDPNAAKGENNVATALDGKRGFLQLSNSKLGVELGYGGTEHGYLTVIDLENHSLVLNQAFASVDLGGPEPIRLPFDTVPLLDNGFRFEDVVDPVFGVGRRLQADFKAKDEPTIIVVEITLFADSRYFIYKVDLKDVAFVGESPPVFHYFEAASNNLVVDEDAEYLTDFSRLRRSYVRDDGIVHEEKIGPGKPIFIWSNKTSRGLLLAALDETETAPSVGIQLEPGRVVAKLGYSTPAAEESLASPRLYVEATNTADTRKAFSNFKLFFAALNPPLPMPEWVKYQWLSWYPLGMNISDEALREQIDYIADNLADLGPWHIIVDAGWYIAEGRPGAGWRSIDYDKFPGGLRPLVDYAHSRGIKVVLYFSTPYLDSREQEGDWLGLKGIIENHRDWLVPIGESEGRESFVYDYTNPDLRDYMEQVMSDYFIRYDVDGIKIDGLGNAEGAILDPNRIDPFGLVGRVVDPTMDIYRFTYETVSSLKKDVYIESGWLTPLFANKYAHTFRYGDEADSFQSPYPFPGLEEHIDYAQVQKMILGQRANMGAMRGDPNDSTINRWMLEAGLAMGTQVVLSFYLPNMDDQALSFYRSLLYHYDAFEGETYYGSPLYADTFATTVRGTTYLGVLNRGTDSKHMVLRLSDFGLADDQGYTVYRIENGTFTHVQKSLDVELAGESFTLFILRADPGVMWTNSSVEYDETPSEITLKVRGPQSIPGFVQLIVPSLGEVSIDSEQIHQQTTDGETERTYQYDQTTHILTLRYSHEGEHEIRIVK